MGDSIKFEKGTYGPRAIVQTEWQDSFLNVLLNSGVVELELNDGKGWRGENVDFLEHFPELKCLVILDLSLNSVEPVHFLTELITLELTTYSDTSVDFKAFPKLEECWFEWIKGSDSLFQCKSLRDLGINRYPNRTSKDFSALVNLNKLSVYNSRIEDLEGICILDKLKYLSLARLRKLESLNGIGSLRSLEELEIETCKGIKSVSEIFGLNELRRLLLIDLGDIDSIDGIENLSNLEEFFFYESTNIVDGNLAPICKLPNLSRISFQNRSHYTHRREDFGHLYS
jgi:hypothetical protein